MTGTCKDNLDQQLDFHEWREKMRGIIESGTGIYNSGTSTNSSGIDYQDSPVTSSTIRSLKNLHEVMELSIETNIQLTNAVNHLSSVQKKFAKDCAKFQNSIQLQFDDFRKMIEGGIKRPVEDDEKNKFQSSLQQPPENFQKIAESKVKLQESEDNKVGQDKNVDTESEMKQPESECNRKISQVKNINKRNQFWSVEWSGLYRPVLQDSKSNDSEYVDAENKVKDNSLKLKKLDEKCKNCAGYVTHSVSNCPYTTNYNKKKFRFENSIHSQSLKRKNDSEVKSVTKRLPSRWDVM